MHRVSVGAWVQEAAYLVLESLKPESESSISFLRVISEPGGRTCTKAMLWPGDAKIR